MRYQVDDDIYYSIDEVIEACEDEDYHRDDDYFEEWVNEMYGSIEIAGDKYYAYDIIEKADDGNLSYLLTEYCNSENESDRENARYELDRGSPGDEVYFQNYTIYILADEEEQNETSAACSTNIEDLRRFIREQELINESAAAELKKSEDDVMQMFGG